MNKIFDESHDLRCKLIKSLASKDSTVAGLNREMSIIMSCTASKNNK